MSTMNTCICGTALLSALLCFERAAQAQPAQDSPASPPVATAPAAPAAVAAAPATPTTPAAAAAPAAAPTLELTVAGYTELYYSYNFNQPVNGITNNHWIDNRHDTFVLSTAVLDFTGRYGRAAVRIALQAGPTADGWYSDGVERRAGASSASPLDAATWKNIQQAYAEYTVPIGRGLTMQAGLLLTPVGYEVAAAKDNFNWSRSSLFLNLPFYHAGVRASYPVNDNLTVATMVTNGWNDATDNNGAKSVSGQLLFTLPDTLSASLLYFGGIERPEGAPEGRSWRHMVDLWAQWEATSWLSLAAHGDVGQEDTTFGSASWYGGALYARVMPRPWFRVAARVDNHTESIPVGATALFSGVKSVSAVTGTLEVRPTPHVAMRLEGRHDFASSPLYFDRNSVADPADPTGTIVPSRASQTVLTVGVTAWF